MEAYQNIPQRRKSKTIQLIPGTQETRGDINKSLDIFPSFFLSFVAEITLDSMNRRRQISCDHYQRRVFSLVAISGTDRVRGRPELREWKEDKAGAEVGDKMQLG